jgi:sugar phosphate permease
MSDTSSGIGRQARWLHLIPVVFLLYTIAYFDRVNIGMALPSISKDLNLSPSQAGLTAGIFFWGYLISFLAAGWFVPRLGAKRTILICLLVWGAFAMGTGLAGSFHELLVLRFLLGLAEGPVWTSVALLLSQWFLRAERGRAFGFWNLSIPFGALLSGPISGLVLTYASWHTMFVIEGLPAWIWAFIWWRAVPAKLAAASWLSAAERQRLESGLAEEQAVFAAAHMPSSWRDGLRQPAVWLLVGAFSLANMVAYGFGLWLPTAIKTASALNIGSVGVLNALPYLTSIFGVVLITRSSDRMKERRFHAGIPMIIIGVLLFIGSHTGSHLVVLQMIIFTLIGFFMFMTLPLISTLITEIFPRELAIPVIAFTGGIGNLFGGFVGPFLVGWLNQLTGDFSLAFSLLGAFGLVGGVLIMSVRPVRATIGDRGVRAETTAGITAES